MQEKIVLVIRDREEQRTISLAYETLYIGRGEENDIVLSDRKVSGTHCVISRSEEGIELVDQGSKNGTFVNGNPVDSSEIYIGDIISVGDVTIEPLLEDTEFPEGSSDTNEHVYDDRRSIEVEPQNFEDDTHDNKTSNIDSCQIGCGAFIVFYGVSALVVQITDKTIHEGYFSLIASLLICLIFISAGYAVLSYRNSWSDILTTSKRAVRGVGLFLLLNGGYGIIMYLTDEELRKTVVNVKFRLFLSFGMCVVGLYIIIRTTEHLSFQDLFSDTESNEP